MQRQVNHIIREFKDFNRVFINNIIVYNKILEEYFYYFNFIFMKFTAIDLQLSLIKIYLKYLSIYLLSQ